METIKNLSDIAPQDLSALERVIGVSLDPTVHQAVVLMVVPKTRPGARIRSPRLAHPEQAADFQKQVTLEK
ncbi:MAG TPA: hypothetical protein VJ783_28750 [Pirellulales bacterium]|nr:hypothetical protein [Pirellulales bacterium]